LLKISSSVATQGLVDEIPSRFKEKGQAFLKKCLIVDASQRAAIGDLLTVLLIRTL
jgi:hypothetical protein